MHRKTLDRVEGSEARGQRQLRAGKDAGLQTTCRNVASGARHTWERRLLRCVLCSSVYLAHLVYESHMLLMLWRNEAIGRRRREHSILKGKVHRFFNIVKVGNWLEVK